MSVALAGFWWPLDTLVSMISAGPSSEADHDAVDVAAVLAGDGDAFARIIQRHQQRIAGRMTRFARQRSEVAELTHDVFVEAFFSLKTFKAKANFEHWLAKIATRVGYRSWKKHRQQADRLKMLQADPPPTPTGESSDSAASEELSLLMARLPPADRLVITLMYLENHSVAEAASLAGWTQTRVKVQAYRARQKLKTMMLDREKSK